MLPEPTSVGFEARVLAAVWMRLDGRAEVQKAHTEAVTG